MQSQRHNHSSYDSHCPPFPVPTFFFQPPHSPPPPPSPPPHPRLLTTVPGSLFRPPSLPPSHVHWPRRNCWEYDSDRSVTFPSPLNPSPPPSPSPPPPLLFLPRANRGRHGRHVRSASCCSSQRAPDSEGGRERRDGKVKRRMHSR